jgi:hypothetical protein
VLGELKGDGDGQLAEFGLLGLFDRELRWDAVANGDVRFEGVLDALFE